MQSLLSEHKKGPSTNKISTRDKKREKARQKNGCQPGQQKFEPQNIKHQRFLTAEMQKYVPKTLICIINGYVPEEQKNDGPSSEPDWDGTEREAVIEWDSQTSRSTQLQILPLHTEPGKVLRAGPLEDESYQSARSREPLTLCEGVCGRKILAFTVLIQSGDEVYVGMCDEKSFDHRLPPGLSDDATWGQRFEAGQRVRMELDVANKTIRYFINGESPCFAHTHIDVSEQDRLYACVSFGSECGQVALVTADHDEDGRRKKRTKSRRQRPLRAT